MNHQPDSEQFSVRISGDGYELLNSDGEVIAWTLEKKWALQILLALEICVPIRSEYR